MGMPFWVVVDDDDAGCLLLLWIGDGDGDGDGDEAEAVMLRCIGRIGISAAGWMTGCER